MVMNRKDFLFAQFRLLHLRPELLEYIAVVSPERFPAITGVLRGECISLEYAEALAALTLTSKERWLQFERELQESAL